MSACLAIDGQPFGLALLDAFRLAGEQMVRVRKVLPKHCEAFLKNARALLTLVGKPLLQAAARMVGNADLIKDMANVVGCADLRASAPSRPVSRLGRALSSFFNALRR